MKNWKENKEIHDNYWGNIYKYLMDNSHKYNTLEEEFLALNKFEMGSRVPIFSFEGKAVQGGALNYIKSKQNIVYNTINNRLDGADYILDLGSGWGRNSISYYLKNPNQKIICGELSDSGRNITTHFIKKYNLPIESIPFNYFDFTSLVEYLKGKDIKKALLFSFHAIEQVDYLNKQDFINLLSLPIDFKAIHIEPVKWQYVGGNFPFNNHYNRNLKEVLNYLEKERILKVNNIDHSYYKANQNSTSKNATLIEWEKL